MSGYHGRTKAARISAKKIFGHNSAQARKNILNGKPTRSAGEKIVVARCLDYSFLIMDGHHRAAAHQSKMMDVRISLEYHRGSRIIERFRSRAIPACGMGKELQNADSPN